MNVAAPDTPPIDELVLVVHGVGDPNPGETLSLFARSLADRRRPLTEQQEVLWLEDPSGDARDVHTFPVHVRQLEFESSRKVLAEVYWGDLSRVRRGLLGVLWGLVQLVFGLRYVAYVAADQPGRAARTLQWLGLTISRLVHGPFLAVNLALLTMMCTVAGTEVLWHDSSWVGDWKNFLAIGCAFLLAMMSAVGRQVTASRDVGQFWFWVGVVAFFLAGLWLNNVVDLYAPAGQSADERMGLMWYCRVLVVLMGALWLILVLIIATMFVAWLAATVRRRVHQPAINVALILPALAIGMWGLALPLIWIAVAASLKQLVNLESFDALFEQAVPLLGVQCLASIVMALLLVSVLVRYLRWRSRRNLTDFTLGHRPPRLIVPPAVLGATAATTLAGIALVLYLAYREIIGIDPRHDHIGHWLAEANKYAIGILVPLCGLLVVSLRFLRPALDIALDVMNHFYFRPVTERDNEIVSNLSDDRGVCRTGAMYFARRATIHERMKRILQHYRRTIPGRPALTIVSHSQGTIISTEVLNSSLLQWLGQRFARITLLTMGSPLSHLYQHYFPHYYPPLSDPYWENLRQRVGRWLNIHRIDDFVGTEIVFPTTDDRPTGTNHAVEKRGHNLYWQDREVLAIIRQHNICHAAGAGGEPADDTSSQPLDSPSPDILPLRQDHSNRAA